MNGRRVVLEFRIAENISGKQALKEVIHYMHGEPSMCGIPKVTVREIPGTWWVGNEVARGDPKFEPRDAPPVRCVDGPVYVCPPCANGVHEHADTRYPGECLNDWPSRYQVEGERNREQCCCPIGTPLAKEGGP